MATIICPGCFDLFHDGHREFLIAVSHLGGVDSHELIVCLNTDESAIALKREKWGAKYLQHSLRLRMAQVHTFGETLGLNLTTTYFESEDELRTIITNWMPCIIAKGCDYMGKKITGADIAPVILINTPETPEIKQMKLRAYSVGNP